MIALTWKAGSKFLSDKGPSIAIVVFLLFASGILFWPHGLTVNMAVGKEPEAIRYEKVSTSYSEDAADLMRVNGELFTKSLSILDNQKYYCLMQHHLGTGEAAVSRPSALPRYERLCGIFTDAAAMVDTYADRLNGWSRFHPELYEFIYLDKAAEQRIGPFLTLEECAEIAQRLASLGERTTGCLPYDESQRVSLYPQRV
ncbi:hypothetical protein [Billgrantia saliphila]|uniref:hypothetical protein n=1 Tax=Billgrantia saliphila TaxID=1848458 RepID=UPI000CE2BFC1|nr:hypothetical protein [Halomonas saliphila]